MLLRFLRKARKYFMGFALLYVAFAAGLLWLMREPIRFGRVMRHVPDPAMILFPFKQLWFVARSGRLDVGDPAPNFALLTSDQAGRVELASFRGRSPVLLVFGSYT